MVVNLGLQCFRGPWDMFKCGNDGNFVLESQEAQRVSSSISGEVPVYSSVMRNQAGCLKDMGKR